ncbi:hypothetical protein MN116_002451 [Schistosoma mekongi]|uniref:Uncharacterized protein n=1 Tax=Schistosoma mekongi TaxID=38744 RepID=A0AAE2D8L8_SCHME|nr:hypothetical protein MN116_002451 [Schistosoma mekongi]
MGHNCGIQEADNIGVQRRKYHLNHFQGQHSESEVNFTLNAFGISLLQLIITFSGTCLFIEIPVISKWIKTNQLILWISSGIYLVLQLIWAFVPQLSRTYPYNILYLLFMTLFSMLAIGSDATLYNIDYVYKLFGVSLTVFNISSFVVTVSQLDFTRFNMMTSLIKLFIDLLLQIGQLIYFISKNQTALLITGVIAFPFTLLKVLIEVEMILGNAGIMYNSWWSLFLTILWITVSIDLMTTN